MKTLGRNLAAKKSLLIISFLLLTFMQFGACTTPEIETQHEQLLEKSYATDKDDAGTFEDKGGDDEDEDYN